MNSKHFLSKDKTLLEALTQINSLAPDPLVLFVVDGENRMLGTLTDGDSRRALIAGASVDDKVEKVMHTNFNYMKLDAINDVKEIKRQKELKMKLVPVLDNDKHIVDIINLWRVVKAKDFARLPRRLRSHCCQWGIRLSLTII